MTESSVVTLLFAGWPGLHEILDQLDDEATAALLRTNFRILRGAVHRHGGREVKSLGDGLMAAFSSVTDAVGCAVEIQQDAVGHHRHSDQRLPVRIGLHSGEPIQDGDDYFGMPVVVAKRLCDRAEAGEILASDVVRLLIGPRSEFNFKELGSIPLKGLLDPIPACQVVWTAKESPMPAPPAIGTADRKSPFVGRLIELDELRQAWSRTERREPAFVAIAGEPGIGKTRLATQFARLAYDSGAIVMFGRCDQEPLMPYQPLVEALRFYVTNCDTAAREVALDQAPPELAHFLPELTERPVPAPPIAANTPNDRYRLFEVVTGLVVEACRSRPVLMVLDDLHWADKSTTLLLRHLLLSIDQAALMIIGTYRDTDLSRGHPFADALADLSRANAVERLNLTGLLSDEVVALVEIAAGHQATAAERAFGQKLWADTGGNALFIRETLRHLTETGVIAGEGPDAASRLDAEQPAISEGIRELIGRRLGRLSDAAAETLTTASAIGTEFPFDLMQELSDLSEDQLLDALDEAVTAGLIVETSVARYGFSHALVRATLYEALSSTRRARLHRRIAESLEGLHLDNLEPYLGELAHQFVQAAPLGDAERAISYAVRAADRANAQLAYDEAAGHLASAVRVLGPEIGTDPIRRCELLLGLSQARSRAGDTTRAHQAWEEAAGVARRNHAVHHFVRAALGRAAGTPAAGTVDEAAVNLLEEALSALGPDDSAMRAEVLARLALHLLYAHADDRRRSLTSDAVAMARRLGDPRVLVTVLNCQLQHWLPDDLASTLATAREVVPLANAAGEKPLMLRGRYLLMLNLLQAGQVAEADSELEAYAALAEELRYPYRSDLVPSLRAMRALMDGRVAEADQLWSQSASGVSPLRQDNEGISQRLGAQLVAIRREQGRLSGMEEQIRAFADRYPAVPGWRAVLAMVWSELAQRDAARREFEVLAQRGFSDIPRDINWTIAMACLTDTCVFLDDAPRAEILYQLLLPYEDHCVINTATTSVCLGVVARYLGLLASTARHWERAARHFQNALDLSVRIQARLWEAHTEHDWAGMLLSRRGPGDVEAAATRLDHALALAEGCGMTRLAERAASLRASF